MDGRAGAQEDGEESHGGGQGADRAGPQNRGEATICNRPYLALRIDSLPLWRFATVFSLNWVKPTFSRSKSVILLPGSTSNSDATLIV